MPTAEHSIVNLPGFHVLEIVRVNPLELRVEYQLEQQCPQCDCKNLRIKDSFERVIRHESFGERECTLKLQAHKFCCLNCGSYFNSRFPGIRPRFRVTEAFRKEVCRKHHHGISRRTLSHSYGIGWSTVERWYHDFLDLRLRELQSRRCPRVLGIDEHFFTRKQGYATTFCNLSPSSVWDITLGRSEAALQPYLTKIQDRDRTRVVVIDLSETYRSIAKKYFKNALIVADRFHVIRLINHQFLQTWKTLDPNGRRNRGLLSLMRRHHINLKTDQKIRLRKYLTETPGLEAVYDFKQSLVHLLTLKHQTKQECRKLIPEFLYKIGQLQSSGLQHMVTLGNTLDDWKEEIARMWRFTKTNSITEGFHNKMETISRNAYGFRSFKNYKIRVKVLCA